MNCNRVSKDRVSEAKTRLAAAGMFGVVALIVLVAASWFWFTANVIVVGASLIYKAA
jgi:hypothetical protein